MAVPGYQRLLRQVLEVVAAGETDGLGLTEADREDRNERLPSGRQAVFYNWVHWAKTRLSQPGRADT